MTSPTDYISVTSYASITGLAILANPCQIPKSKTFLFDAQLYIGSISGSGEAIIGTLRYFNGSDTMFSEQPRLYVICATLARVEEDAMISDAIAKYQHFIGDITWVQIPWWACISMLSYKLTQ
ncbi:hypothetical protein BD779DRAFT_1473537 [Infundibulicybe gibba]|nr:hypothetical protein BD779DRAFT_1473537 [Infundibulicybe gibba]